MLGRPSHPQTLGFEVGGIGRVSPSKLRREARRTSNVPNDFFVVYFERVAASQTISVASAHRDYFLEREHMHQSTTLLPLSSPAPLTRP